MTALFNAECPCRLSFYVFHNEEFENTSSFVADGDGIFDWDDGYCRICGKDFRSEGRFCSSLCEAKYLDSLKMTCDVCGKKIDIDKQVEHHVSYDPEKIIYVHLSCHQQIHKSDRFHDLKPSQEAIDQYYAKEKAARHARENRKEKAFHPDEHGYYNCYRCKSRFISIPDLRSHLLTHKSSSNKNR